MCAPLHVCLHIRDAYKHVCQSLAEVYMFVYQQLGRGIGQP